MTTRAEEIAGEGHPDSPDREKWPHDERAYVDGMNASLRAAFVKGYKQGQQDRWICVEDESKLPPIHEEPFTEDGFVMILFQCDDWPGKYKTMKASRTSGDWAEDGSPLWFGTDGEGEISDDDDNLIRRWTPIPPPKP